MEGKRRWVGTRGGENPWGLDGGFPPRLSSPPPRSGLRSIRSRLAGPRVVPPVAFNRLFEVIAASATSSAASVTRATRPAHSLHRPGEGHRVIRASDESAADGNAPGRQVLHV